MYVLAVLTPLWQQRFFVLFFFWVEFTQCPQSSPIYDTKAKSQPSESVLKG